jgi:hypothetical protein
MANSKKQAVGGAPAKGGGREAQGAASTRKGSGSRARGAKPSRSTAGTKAKAPARKAAAAAKRASGVAKRGARKAAPAARARKAPAKPAPARAANRRGRAPGAVPGLNEEDQIRAAKYLPRELPKRLFEEERFVFPESYGQNRIRLLVRDPEWIFAYWDVKPQSLEELAKRLGERTIALSRLTLRVVDPVSGGSSDILLPAGARWWYVRTDSARRTYRAELGVTLPSGEFRRLAESNTVVTPRVGPSPERARRRISYRDANELAPAVAAAAGRADRLQGLAREPWAAESLDAGADPGASRTPVTRGGASDVFRPGGASDAFKR